VALNSIAPGAGCSWNVWALLLGRSRSRPIASGAGAPPRL